jgi:hypothetical protein
LKSIVGKGSDFIWRCQDSVDCLPENVVAAIASAYLLPEDFVHGHFGKASSGPDKSRQMALKSLKMNSSEGPVGRGISIVSAL